MHGARRGSLISHILVPTSDKHCILYNTALTEYLEYLCIFFCLNYQGIKTTTNIFFNIGIWCHDYKADPRSFHGIHRHVRP